MSDDSLLVDQITRPVAAEAALVVSADIKPLDRAQDGHRWFVPAGGVVFARDPGLDANGRTAVMDAPGRTGQFPQVTAFLDDDDVAAHADSLFVLGVAPDGTRVTGEEVNRNRHTFSRISVQVAGTCTLAARKTERFRFGDLVCASLIKNKIFKFRGADKAFTTRDLEPWQPDQTREPRSVSTLSAAAISYNLLHGLQSIVAANPGAKLVEVGGALGPFAGRISKGTTSSSATAFEVGTTLQDAWSLKTWTFLMKRFTWPAGFIATAVDPAIVAAAAAITADVEEFAGVAFDGNLRAELENSDGHQILKRTVGPASQEAGLISLTVETEIAAIVDEYTKLKEEIKASECWDPRKTYGQAWRAVAKSTGPSLTPPPDVDGAGVVSKTKANQENLMLCLFYEALGRGPLAIPDDDITAYLDNPSEWKAQLTWYSKMVDAAAPTTAAATANDAATAIDAEIKKHRRAALRWAGSTTAPFARVLEVGVNELRVELQCHLSAD